MNSLTILPSNSRFVHVYSDKLWLGFVFKHGINKLRLQRRLKALSRILKDAGNFQDVKLKSTRLYHQILAPTLAYLWKLDDGMRVVISAVLLVIFEVSERIFAPIDHFTSADGHFAKLPKKLEQFSLPMYADFLRRVATALGARCVTSLTGSVCSVLHLDHRVYFSVQSDLDWDHEPDILSSNNSMTLWRHIIAQSGIDPVFVLITGRDMDCAPVEHEKKQDGSDDCRYDWNNSSSRMLTYYRSTTFDHCSSAIVWKQSMFFFTNGTTIDCQTEGDRIKDVFNLDIQVSPMVKFAFNPVRVNFHDN